MATPAPDPSPLDRLTDARRDGVRADLLAWYDVHARVLPWRTPPGAPETPDPYRVWLSEVMLQQTTVAAVIPRLAAFLAAFPTVEALAAASEARVLAAWAGLGYYARARNLHACAKVVAARGGFPEDLDGLRALPGVGAYTAAAVAAIAFHRPHTPVDGNVERVLARLVRHPAPPAKAKPAFARLARRFDDAHRPGDFAQALMDLGAGVCTPRAPDCDACPIARHCEARAAGDVARFPVKAVKPPRAARHGRAFVILCEAGVLLRRRPRTGLLAAMVEPPGTPWTPEPAVDDTPHRPVLPGMGPWVAAGVVAHVFTHLDLRLEVLACRIAGRIVPPADHFTTPVKELGAVGLPTLMAKAVALGLEALARD
jgi:A/G-specific adenine glycosylase